MKRQKSRIKSKFILEIFKYIKYLNIWGGQFSELPPPYKNLKKEREVPRRLTSLKEAIRKTRAEGLEIKDNGNMLCPFHRETKPSAYLYYNLYHNQVEFHCFGCGRSYSFERFLSLVSDEESKEREQRYSLEYIANVLNRRFLALLSGIGDYEEQALSVKALEYLRGRGFDEEDIERVGIGFSSRKYLGSIEEFKINHYISDEARSCFLVYPIRNREGRVCSLQLEDFLNRGKLEKTKFNLKSKVLPLCFLKPYSQDVPYVVCEGFLDALSIEKLSPRFEIGSVALLGNPSKEQKEELKALAKSNEIVLAFDNDEAGKRYQNEILKELVLVNPYIEGIDLPDGIKDINELLRERGIDGIKEVIAKARRFTPFGNVKERIPEILEKFRIAKGNAFLIPKTLSYLEEFFKDGLLPGLYGVAGIPGIGKTTWLNLLCDELAKIGAKSIYFLTEEPEHRLLLRSIKRESLKRFEELIEMDWVENRIIFELTPEYTAESLKEIVSNVIEREGKAIFVVDSLHALQLRDSNFDTREKVILKTELLAHIARDLIIPVFFTSFIPKSLYKEKPSIGIFKEAGEIEYLIDVGIVIWKSVETSNKDESIPFDLCIVKNRFGKTGNVELLFDVSRCDIRRMREGELK